VWIPALFSQPAVAGKEAQPARFGIAAEGTGPHQIALVPGSPHRR
jgi:hypothetical protein